MHKLNGSQVILKKKRTIRDAFCVSRCILPIKNETSKSKSTAWTYKFWNIFSLCNHSNHTGRQAQSRAHIYQSSNRFLHFQGQKYEFAVISTRHFDGFPTKQGSCKYVYKENPSTELQEFPLQFL